MLGGNLNSGSLGAILANGGTLSPGNSGDPTGTIITTSAGLALDIRAGSTLAIQLGGTATGDYDRFIVNGQVSLGGGLSLSLVNGFVPAEGMAFTLVSNDAADAVSGTFSGLPNGAAVVASSSIFTINYAGGDGNDVVLTAIPEPASGALCLAGFVLITRRRHGVSRR